MPPLWQCQDGDLENRLRQLRTGPAIGAGITDRPRGKGVLRGMRTCMLRILILLIMAIVPEAVFALTEFFL